MHLTTKPTSLTNRDHTEQVLCDVVKRFERDDQIAHFASVRRKFIEVQCPTCRRTKEYYAHAELDGHFRCNGGVILTFRGTAEEYKEEQAKKTASSHR